MVSMSVLMGKEVSFYLSGNHIITGTLQDINIDEKFYLVQKSEQYIEEKTGKVRIIHKDLWIPHKSVIMIEENNE